MSEVVYKDFRAILRPKGGVGTLGEHSGTNPLSPIIETNGLIFPYTPSVNMSNESTYDSSTFHFLQNNYAQNAYSKSGVSEIQVSGKFTAQTDVEARYTLAAIHFFRYVTKCFFGNSEFTKAGLPPPILIFNYLGDFIFREVPVVVSTFSSNFPQDVDYVPVSLGLPGNFNTTVTYVPIQMDLTVSLLPHYTPKVIQDTFSLEKFRDGSLVRNPEGYI